jgi:hypothetical protein
MRCRGKTIFRNQSTFGRSGQLRAIAAEQLAPLHHVPFAPILFDQLADAVTAPALASPAFNTKHVELALDVAEYDVGAGHSCYDCFRLTRKRYVANSRARTNAMT